MISTDRKLSWHVFEELRIQIFRLIKGLICKYFLEPISSSTVHRRRIHQCGTRSGLQVIYGRQRCMAGQRVRRTLVAIGQVRAGLPEGLSGC
jgi:hypothetical protein